MKINNELYKLHCRLGHLSIGKIKLASQKGLLDGISLTPEEINAGDLDLCYDCMRGRMRADPKGSVTNHEWKVFEKVAVDYKGPFNIKSKSGKRGFFLFSDYRTDYVWAYMVKEKSEFLDALKAFLAEHNHGPKIKAKTAILQGDYDTVHRDKKISQYLKRKGIKLQLSAPYVHSQNGQIERDMGNVLNRARSIMSTYDTPPSLWDYAIIHACYLINLSPTSKEGNKTPYEYVYNIRTDSILCSWYLSFN
jgi:hypothetical protein